VRLGDLAAGLDGLAGAAPQAGAADVEITSLAHDSRAVAQGTLFLCVPGFRADGHRFAPAAVEAGAAALVVERPLGLGVPELEVRSVRAAMAPLAARFYGDPADQLLLVGVTGTNGKTTSAYLVRELLEAGGMQCGLLGTVKSVIGGSEREVVRTTPEAIELQSDLRAMVDGGDRACAIEVSSHALELGRADAIGFAAALFTNLTQDHLDFHPTMEDYFLAKRKLFLPGEDASAPPPRLSVLNAGDPYGRRLAEEIPGAVTFAVEAEADYAATGLRCGFGGCAFRLRSPEGELEVELPMPGRFNVANALGALAVAHGLGVPMATLVETLARGVHVPGRFEPVERGQDFAVLVDYAHTPDSLENVLSAAQELLGAARAPGAGRVLCVFGAGGDRDRGKRPLMGEIAARLADITIVTSDNPRSEAPEAIIEEIMAGAGDAREGVLETVEDRRAAIARAVSLARAGDVLVIAGKGHEQGQELAGGQKIPFDDVAVAGEELDARQPFAAASSGQQ
jgi:UDP-N-acetylmuramoyl-L-alanyl-D-glutamate--2,6-diaminopimelate ligase